MAGTNGGGPVIGPRFAGPVGLPTPHILTSPHAPGDVEAPQCAC